MLRLTRSLAAETGMKNLCLAGGVALNCVANGKVLRDGHFSNIWIQPAAGDAGGALGAALAAYHITRRHERRSELVDGMSGAYLGPEFDQPDIEQRLTDVGADLRPWHAKTCWTRPPSSRRRPSRRLVPGSHGVRTARARHSLDPRRPAQPDHAEEPQPQGQIPRKFPAVCAGRCCASTSLIGSISTPTAPICCWSRPWPSSDSGTMTRRREALFGIDKLNVPRSDIPAVTHVDYSARIQTVHRETNPRSITP